MKILKGLVLLLFFLIMSSLNGRVAPGSGLGRVGLLGVITDPERPTDIKVT
jgi:hypothetical protein